MKIGEYVKTDSAHGVLGGIIGQLIEVRNLPWGFDHIVVVVRGNSFHKKFDVVECKKEQLVPFSLSETLSELGWVIECESPLEIKHQDGSIATGQAANLVIDTIISNL